MALTRSSVHSIALSNEAEDLVNESAIASFLPAADPPQALPEDSADVLRSKSS